MKDIFSNIAKASLKFILIFAILFIIFFASIFLFHLFPFFKIGGGLLNQILNQLLFPSFSLALYNSLIYSLFLYGIIIINYQKKHRIIYFIFSILISTVIVFSIHFFLKPSVGDISFNNINDARVYFNEKSFFIYKDKIPERIAKSIFEKGILFKIEDQSKKKALADKYIYNMKDDSYHLRSDLNAIDSEKILSIFYQTGYLSEKKFYFTKIEKSLIKNVIYIKNDLVYTFNEVDVSFIQDKIYLFIRDTEEKFEFEKTQLNEYDIYQVPLMKNVFNTFSNLPYKFFVYKNIIYIIFLWISIAMLITGFSTVIILGDYPFLSMVFKIIFLILFYFGFSICFDIFERSYTLFLPSYLNGYHEIIFCSLILFLSLLIHLLRFIFFKTNIWEKE